MKNMKCLINDIIRTSMKRNKQTEVIHRYLRMKHHIMIDQKSIHDRMDAIKMNYQF